MNQEIKPSLGLMAHHSLLKQLEDEVATIEDRKSVLKQDLERFALSNDKTSWSQANEKLKNLDKELKWCSSKKKSLENKSDKDNAEEELQKKQERSSSMKKLFSENHKLRNELQSIINSLINKFKAIESLHVKRVDEVPDVSEPERLAFNQDTYFHDFFMVLSSHPEALRFLQVAKKMEYRQMPKIRKMKDYQYEETSDTAH